MPTPGHTGWQLEEMLRRQSRVDGLLDALVPDVAVLKRDVASAAVELGRQGRILDALDDESISTRAVVTWRQKTLVAAVGISAVVGVILAALTYLGTSS